MKDLRAPSLHVQAHGLKEEKLEEPDRCYAVVSILTHNA